MLDNLNELRDRAIQGRKAWSVLYRRMDAFLFTVFSAKVKREDHAEHGREPNLENGECPVMLCDYRHEVKFLTYTVTKRDRIRKLMDAVNQVHLVHEEKKKALAEEPPRELTKEEIEGIKHHLKRSLNASPGSLSFKHNSTFRSFAALIFSQSLSC